MNTKPQTTRRAAILQNLDKHPLRSAAIWALILNLVIECLSQRSVLQALLHFVTDPFPFVLGSLILFFTLCIGLLVPKRLLTQTILSLLWLGLAMANFVLQGNRVTPLAAIDFSILPSVFSIIRIYLSLWQIIGICVLFAAAIALLILLGLRSPRQKIRPLSGCAALLTATALVVLLTAVGIFADALPRHMDNLADAYRTYGFVYCFTTSIYDRGIDRPEEYETEIDELAQTLDEAPPETPPEPEAELQLPKPEPPPIAEPQILEQKPEPAEQEPIVNVIFLQLESFVDPEELTCFSCSENPCPNFQRLKRTSASGYLTVPAIGAGTANTEFEVISGMSLSFFGTGEYPYRTVLRDNTCETVAFNLKEHGYTTTAIHNNKATFYDRNQVFPHLGFDRFISLEYMNGVRQNPLGWACDDVLVQQILDTLETTPERDMIYTISVQGHGKYPDERLEDTGGIEVFGAEDEIEENRVEYYVNQIAEMDAFLAQLTQALSAFEEPVVLVMYGDHIPNLDLTEEDVASENLFQTEYVLWSNFGLRTEDQDLYAYQLSAYVMKLLGYTNGNLTRLHQKSSASRDYQKLLEMLEYDMLYGEQVVFDGQNPYQPTQLQMGLKDVQISTVAFDEEKLVVFGENFTPYSVVCTDGRQQETTFVDDQTLFVEGVSIEDVHVVLVQQVSEDAVVLSEAAPYVLQ